MYNLRAHVRKTSEEAKNKLITFDFDGTEVHLYNCTMLPGVVRAILMQLRTVLKNRFISKLDSIYIGDLNFLRERGFTGLYENNTLYVLESDDIEEMKRSIIHEISHALEKEVGQYITENEIVQNEFLAKRIQLYDKLEENGFKVERDHFLMISYDKDFDNLLINNIGLERLADYSKGIFMSPYSATSINEYVADGYENWFLSKEQLNQTCPKLRVAISDFLKLVRAKREQY